MSEFKEPLTFGKGYEQLEPGRYLADADGLIVFAEGEDAADAVCWELFSDDQLRRIVACVNALKGAKTSDLEEAVRLGITDVSMGNLFSSRLKLTRERDEARAMVAELEKRLNSTTNA